MRYSKAARKKISVAQRERWRKYHAQKQNHKKEKSEKNGDIQNSSYFQEGFEVGCLLRGIQADIDTFVLTHRTPFTRSGLRERVGTFLVAQAGGEVDNNSEHLPSLRGGSAEGHEVRPSSKAVHGKSPRKAPRKSKSKLKRSAGARGWWAKLTPEQRSEEMRRRRNLALRNKRQLATAA